MSDAVKISNLTDQLDLARDEFQRILALPCSKEIKGLCERALTSFDRKVPVLLELVMANAELATLRAKLEEKERDAKRMASDNLELCDKLEEVALAHATLQEQHRQQAEELARANRLLERAAGELELSTEIYPRAGLPNTAPLIARLAADLRAHLAAIDQARREGA